MIIKQRRVEKNYIEIFVGRLDVHNQRRLTEFLQAMANRLIVGGYRYGKPKSTQKYYSRLKKELKVYKRGKNKEHLINIANYAYLELIAPELEGTKWNNLAESVTRRTFGV